MDLIDRDKLIEMLAEMQGRCATKAALVQNSKIWRLVKAMPTVDAIPIEWMKQKYPAAVNHDSVRYIAKVDPLNEIIEEWRKEE